ncbi:hypothetical protein QYF36_010721 [Acer negundo]|nr:hypothetical protein QYF36_010721 [Acer negundo]
MRSSFDLHLRWNCIVYCLPISVQAMGDMVDDASSQKQSKMSHVDVPPLSTPQVEDPHPATPTVTPLVLDVELGATIVEGEA